MIKFEKVFVKYVNDFFSLFDCNIQISNHTLLHEKNLCGSSAFFRCLAKIDKNFSGEIYIDDVNLKNIKDKDLNISYLPQIPVLFKNKSIEFNLSYPLKIRKTNKKTIKNDVNSIILKYNLNIFNKKIKYLNLSEQKIISLIRATIRNPKYLTLENFFENLDKNYYNLAIQILNKLKEKTIIIACEKNDNIEFFKDFKTIEV